MEGVVNNSEHFNNLSRDKQIDIISACFTVCGLKMDKQVAALVIDVTKAIEQKGGKIDIETLVYIKDKNYSEFNEKEEPSNV